MYSMADITKVSERGQTAIPARLRREHRVESGTELVWEAIGPDEWRVHISRKPLQAPDPAAMRGFARRFRAVKTTREWLRELREGEGGDASRGDESE
jgi:bifunctional DNA-binding transcriptional regulator/antitoxin component of YhaV-PrlF toxin-antitoxin module